MWQRIRSAKVGGSLLTPSSRLPALLTDLMLLVLTIRKVYSHDVTGDDSKRSKLVSAIAHDQILYFIGFLFVAGVNIPIIAFNPLLICVAFGFVLGFPLIMGCRMFLNLREIADESEVPNEITLSELVFASGALSGGQSNILSGISRRTIPYAHANAARQAKELIAEPVEVVVGVHSDEEITRHKGPPLFDEKERYALVRNCRWVSRVEEDVPYATQPDVFEKYNVDLIVHGDDPAIDAEGNDCYAIPKALGRYKEVKRTEGISTTSLIDRILYPERLSDIRKADTNHLRNLLQLFSESCVPRLPVIELRSPSADVELLFQSSDIGRGQEIVAYIDGSWDCFCAAHVDLLQSARDATKKLFPDDVIVKLVVGIDDDRAAQERIGESPIFLQCERALDVAQCRFVDAIVMKSAQDLSSGTLLALGVRAVVCWDEQRMPSEASKGKDLVYVDIASHSNGKGSRFYTSKKLRERLQSNLAAYEARQIRKSSRT
ncbi:hypothetical protein SCHPADRAFT_934648 [Schizopora paradoxa]|uniref:ethanolamine-phosphate cytidylyltransferase n=1 Tax=Schizopora paradoxa TaxID=27342 RepID=A0A0H2S6V8_9AGAM|nr:hypothetical protein SCHPADRAFT_934648 [Schizopora paradoxa]